MRVRQVLARLVSLPRRCRVGAFGRPACAGGVRRMATDQYELKKLFIQNDQMLWKRIVESENKKDGLPVRKLIGKWASHRRRLGASNVIEILHAVWRYKVPLTPFHVDYLARSVESRSLPLRFEKEIGKLLLSTRALRDNKDTRRLISAFVPKIEGCEQKFKKETILAVSGLSQLWPSRATDSLFTVLSSKVRDSSEDAITPDSASAALFGLRRQKPSKPVREFISVLADGLRVTEDVFAAQNVSNALSGLQGMRGAVDEDLAEVDSLLGVLGEHAEGCTDAFSAYDIGNSMAGIKYVADRPEAARVLGVLAEKIKENKSPLGKLGVRSCVSAVPYLGGSAEGRAVVGILADKLATDGFRPDKGERPKEAPALKRNQVEYIKAWLEQQAFPEARRMHDVMSVPAENGES